MKTYVAGDEILASDLNGNFTEVVNDLKSAHHRKAGYSKIEQADVDSGLHLLTEIAQTLTGIKTLGSIPVMTASNPTTGNHATRKTYVDGLRRLKYVEMAIALVNGAGNSTWTDWDLSAFIPSGALYVEIYIQVPYGSGSWGVRKNGSAISRVLSNGDNSIQHSGTITADLDAGRIIEHYSSKEGFTFNAMGYWIQV